MATLRPSQAPTEPARAPRGHALDLGPSGTGADDAPTDTGGDRAVSFATLTASLSTATEAPDMPLRGAEIESLRRQMPFAVALVILAAVLLFLGVGAREARPVLQAALAIALTATALGVYAVRHERVCTPRFLAVHAIMNAAAFGGACYFVGAFSPLAGFLLLNQYRGSSSPRGRLDLLQYGFNALMLLAIQLPIALGTADPGLIRADDLGNAPKLVIAAAVQLGLGAALILGRAQRERLLDAIRRRDTAVRSAAAQDVLLLEAQHAFDRALQLGSLGRFSEQTLGHYRLGTVIGRGGMGEVYEAVHIDDNSAAAVKLLRSTALDDPEIVRRFLREISVIRRLRSPRIVEVLEVGDEAFPYIAMERLRGEDLAKFLRRERTLPLEEVAEMVEQIAEALEVAAASDVVHRDLKPSNVFRCDDPRSWKVLDFGVAKVGENPGTLTEGNMLGTLHYMAPEQARGHDVDIRADIFALGAVAYRALCGQPPSPGADPLHVLKHLLNDAPAAPSTLARVPEQVDWVFAVALAKEPDDRFARPHDLATALHAAVAGRIPRQLERRARRLMARHPPV